MKLWIMYIGVQYNVCIERLHLGMHKAESSSFKPSNSLQLLEHEGSDFILNADQCPSTTSSIAKKPG